MGDLLHNLAIVFKQVPPIFGNPDAGDPLMQLALRVHAQILDILGILGLDLGMLDAKAEVGRRLVLAPPAHPIVHLVHIKGGETDQVLGRLLALGRVVAGGAEDKVELLPGLLAVRLEPDVALELGGPHPAAGEVFLQQLLPEITCQTSDYVGDEG